MSKSHSAALGSICCALAAVFYTGSSICMKQIASLNCDPGWAVCLKELVTVVIVGPVLIYRGLRGLPVFPPVKILLILILAGLTDQLIGNLGWQWAIGIVGLVVTVPAAFGVMIASSAIFGLILLGERVTPRSTLAIGLLLVSLIFLGMGAQSAGQNATHSAAVAISAVDAETPDTLLLIQAVIVAGVAGAAYSLLSIAIRHTMNAATQMSTLMFIVTGMGVITLGPICIHRQGIERLLATPYEQLAWILAAGIFNLLGFMSITKGLHLTTVVRANVLNASQVAMAAVAGMLIFNESPNLWLLSGVVLTVMGICLVDRPVAEEAVDQAI
jgi:drug/metabolite transporter, DME family